MDYLCDNAMFKSSILSNSLKLADVTPLHKKGRKEVKEDTRSVSILPTLSKLFEITMFAQISALYLSIYSTQYWKLKMLKKWKKYVGKGNFINRPLKGI